MPFQYVSNAANGYGAQDVLQNKLLALRREGSLSIVVKTYRAGDPNARNADQFYAPFMIQFQNGQRWVIFSTTSCRTDRIKGQQWDADNLKRLDPSIEKAMLTYPDDTGANDVRMFNSQKRKYDTGLEISRIDDVLCHSDLVEQIKARSQGIYWESHHNEDIVSSTETVISETEAGRQFDLAGRSFESDIASLLENGDYLIALKQGNEIADNKFKFFKDMLSVFGGDVRSVAGIRATAKKEDIGLLPSGGQPKTDVIVKLADSTGSVRYVTVSCKRTTRDSVSVHQYSADAFADVLDANDDSLRSLLKVFQYYANARDMPEGDRIALESALRPHMRKLCLWVLGGYGGECANKNQLADNLVVYNPTDGYFKTHTVEEYTQLLLNRSPLAFGTPFGWTYASGQRQQSIQLKLPIIR